MSALMQMWMPGPVLLLGAPGVGKGTQAQLMVELWKVPQVSTGDLIRENIRLCTSIGKQFKKLVDAGIFVPDDIVNEMVADRIRQTDCVSGFILDGFPRTVGQARWLDATLQTDFIHSPFKQQSPSATASQKGVLAIPLVAISLHVRYNELLRRITGRRTSPVSKRIYNIYTNPPIVEGMCDVDGVFLVQRPDDTVEIFEERMRIFATQTAPVIAHYRELGRFEEINGEQDVEVVSKQIDAALRRLRGTSVARITQKRSL